MKLFYPSPVAAGNNIAKYYEATSSIEKKLMGETKIEVITPRKTYNFYGPTEKNNWKWSHINSISCCINEYQRVSGDKYIESVITNRNGELQNWFDSFDGILFTIDEDYCIPFHLSMAILFHNNRMHNEIPLKLQKVIGTKPVNGIYINSYSDDGCIDFEDGSEYKFKVPTFRDKRWFDIMLIKAGKYYAQMEEPFLCEARISQYM